MAQSMEVAETLALKVLCWIVTHENLLPAFLGSTGASVDDIKAQATDRAFLGTVLEFLTSDDTWVVDFCDVHGVDYEQPMLAAQVLLGTARTHWT
ncbi:DUF3572 domain-containing protein [Pseudopelagicola sp. nBUS_20]|uniref:DUF3572 domain-containing protein n=1 Tax=Pseudopelagicola sp. nBUS_20 TaxID=3395317 RepID=UPI003EBA4195